MEFGQKLRGLTEAILAKGKSSTPIEVSLQEAQEEVSDVEITRFPEEVREALLQRGYSIYPLKGKYISEIEESGLRVIKNFVLEDMGVLDYSSLPTEVAINPDQLFLPDSNFKTEKEQELQIAQLGGALQEEIPGIQVMRGGVSDFIELAYRHLDATGKHLFGESDNFGYTRTSSGYRGARAIVGCFDSEEGIDIDLILPEQQDEVVFVAPLVFPSALFDVAS